MLEDDKQLCFYEMCHWKVGLDGWHRLPVKADSLCMCLYFFSEGNLKIGVYFLAVSVSSFCSAALRGL